MSTGNQGLDALADAIADRVIERMKQSDSGNRLFDVPAAARYLGSTPAAVRGLIAKGSLPCARRGRRVFCDRADLDRWIELRKSRG